MGNKEDNPYYVWGRKIAELKKDIELVLYSTGIYDWPEPDQEFLQWLHVNEKINGADKRHIQSKMQEVAALNKNISDSLNQSISDNDPS